MLVNKILATTLLVLSWVVAAGEQASVETLVVTGTREQLSRKNLTGNTEVLDQQTLYLVGHNHIQESLVRITGANVARGNGQEYFQALRSPVLTRAGACGSVLAAMDGIALRAAGFCNINELFEAPTE